jgi:hypothetical protein
MLLWRKIKLPFTLKTTIIGSILLYLKKIALQFIGDEIT